MEQFESLGRALAGIDAIEQRIAGIVSSEPEAWRFKLIEARRDLGRAMQLFAEAISACERAGAPLAKLADLREKFSAYRHLMAVHHASHPVCVIAEADDYMASAGRVRQAQRVLADTTQQVMTL